MGMKLKSGADLCGFQLTNFCVQGEASAPSDAALGRKYFHTNATDDVATGISLLNRERIYLGEGAWRATAYLDDIAAINEKLNLITGDTDTDTLINNLKDLEEFLKDFSETDKLKSLLDAKLNTSGGTITSSNYDGLIIKRASDSAGALIAFENNGGRLGLFGFEGAKKVPIVYLGADTSSYKTLIHSGNVGEYAVEYLGASKADDARHSIGLDNGSQGSVNLPEGGGYISFGHNSYGGQLLGGLATNKLYFRALGNNVWFDWKTVAFTDSDITGYSAGLKHSNGTIGAVVNSSGNVTIGASDLAGTSYKFAVNGNASINISEQNPTSAAELTRAKTFSIQHGIDNRFGLHSWIMGNGSACIQSCYVDQYHNKTHPLILNPFGSSVLIGTTTDSGYKLNVHGAGYFDQYNASGNKSGASIIINKGGDWFGIGAASNVSHLALGYVNASGVWKSEVMTFKGDNVHIKGNLIVDGEVSAGGAGAEEGTSGSGSAEGVSEIFTPTSTSMAFDHNLGEDVIVQVYEKSGNVWNMVMVDTEITSATRVTLRFGKTETTQHKVVIMGV